MKIKLALPGILKSGCKIRTGIKAFGITLLVMTAATTSVLSQSLPVVATWYGNKTAAVSLTFDDAMPLQFHYAVPELNKRGLDASFYLVMGQYEDGGIINWPSLGWQPVDWNLMQTMADSGHELGGHGLYHDNNIKPGLDVLHSHFPTKKWWTWAYAVFCCASTESRTMTVSARTGNNVVEDSVPADMWNVQSAYPPWTLKTFLNTAEQKKGWFVETLHCISDDARPKECDLAGGYLLSQFRADLDTLVGRKNTLWVGTYGDVARYIRERQAKTITQVSSDAVTQVFNLTDNLPDSIFTQPLTLKHKLQAGWTGCTVKQGALDLPVTMKSDTAIFNAIPDAGTITVTKK